VQPDIQVSDEVVDVMKPDSVGARQDMEPSEEVYLIK